MFDFQDKPYAIVVEIAVACLLSGMLYLLSSSGVISIHPFTYFVLTPIIVLILVRKRKQEAESKKNNK